MLVDHDLWVVVSGQKPSCMKKEDWDFADRKDKGLIRLRIADSILLNVHEGNTACLLWKKLGDIYQGKSLVNKLSLRKKLYSLKMDGGMSVADHLNAFNMVLA